MNAGAQQARGNFLLFLHADSKLPARFTAASVLCLPVGELARQLTLALRVLQIRVCHRVCRQAASQANREVAALGLL